MSSSNLPPNVGPPAAESLFASDWLEIGRFRCPENHPRWSADNFMHGYEIVFPRVPVEIAPAGAARVVADANSAMCYNAQTVYRRRQIVDRGDDCEWFAIAPDVIRDVLAVRDPRVVERGPELFQRLRAPAPPRVYRDQRLLTMALGRGAAVDSLWVEERTLTLLGELFMADAAELAAPRRHSAAPIAAALEFLGRYYAANVPIARVADAAELSLFHFCRLFRAEVGCTVHRYRVKLRIRAALELLAETDREVAELAVDLGFCDQCHFTNAFRREMQMTPAAFRRACVRGGWRDTRPRRARVTDW